jgi:hypothetical protein
VQSCRRVCCPRLPPKGGRLSTVYCGWWGTTIDSSPRLVCAAFSRRHACSTITQYSSFSLDGLYSTCNFERYCSLLLQFIVTLQPFTDENVCSHVIEMRYTGLFLFLQQRLTYLEDLHFLFKIETIHDLRRVQP